MTTLTHNIFSFLSDLSENNQREWFLSHKEEYEKAKAEITIFFKEVYAEMERYDPLGDMKIYRIYNDLRFAKDKPLYKTHFGLYFPRKQPKYRGGYYLHISPNESFVGGGFFNPEPKDLLRIRQEIAMEADAFTQIVQGKEFKKFFGTLWGEEVKTAPKGFSKDDPMIAFLRKKQFLLKRDFSTQAVLEKTFFKEVIASFLAMRPFFDFMTTALTTDLNGNELY